MNWKEQLEKHEHSKDWESAIELMQKTISDNPNDVEVYVRVIYLLHNILVEEDYPESDHDHIAGLLKQYFNESYKRFSDNAEYLFFIGKILYIAEWYFGIDDDFNPVEEKQAFQMQKKAFEKEPGNVLFEWAYRFSLDDKLAGYLAEQILLHDNGKVEWLRSKGFPGRYILESLERSKEKHKLYLD
ncbi:MAG: hypothetical protein H6555_11910 [Lewinellaceae bacterium]|nr:hypothetical protein [Lewinellaceae bacterium]